MPSLIIFTAEKVEISEMKDRQAKAKASVNAQRLSFQQQN